MSSFFNSLGISKSKFLESRASTFQEANINPIFYPQGLSSISSLSGSGRRFARSRQQIYEKWSFMEGDSICSTALKLLNVAALGREEHTGQIVYIEKTPLALKDKRYEKYADDIIDNLTSLFNNIAYSSAYTASAFGDAYVRIYTKEKKGVVDIVCDEFYRPPMVQPFMKGSKTIGFYVHDAKKVYEKLDITQLGRLEMPRTQYIPQTEISQKDWMRSVSENDIDILPLMPSMVGGSFLYAAEDPFDNLAAALAGIVGQRIADSIDEAIIPLNMEFASEAQQRKMTAGIAQMFLTSKKRIDDAIKSGRPILERIRHILPTYNEKQMTTLLPMQSSRSAIITIEDVLLHARMLSATFGVDLSLLGFADQMNAMFGDGGQTTSGLVANHASIIRKASTDFFYDLLDVHTTAKYGFIFPEKERPVQIKFYGSIAAYEREKERSTSNAIQNAILKTQAIQTAKDTGFDEKMLFHFLVHDLLMNEDDAKIYSKLANQATTNDAI